MTAEVNCTMRNHTLLRELTIVLVIKTILLAALWNLFFSQPSSRGLDAVQVSQALVATDSPQDIPAKEAPRHDH